nr:hypothetical protein [Dyadobacter sp. CY356]
MIYSQIVIAGLGNIKECAGPLPEQPRSRFIDKPIIVGCQALIKRSVVTGSTFR